MKLKYFSLLAAYFIVLSSMNAQTFSCDGSFFISLNNGAPTTTHKIEYDGTTTSFNAVATTNLNVNATGYNREDNYIYAGNRATNEIIRLHSDGNFDVIGIEPSISIWNTGAGDCSPEGIYTIHNRNTDRLYFYNVVGTFSLITSVELTWAPSTGNTGTAILGLDDIVFDPSNSNIIYTYQRNYANGVEPVNTRGMLLRINGDMSSPQFGQVEIVGPIQEDVIRHIGAMFFDSNLDLYGYGTLQSSLPQNRFIFIDKTTGNSTFIAEGPGASNNDGCSCPFSVELEKSVLSTTINCDSTEVVYEITLINRSNEDLGNLTFRDILPGGGILTSLQPNLPLGGSIASGSGIGTGSLIFNNVGISDDEVITFTISMIMPTATGTYSNQAIILGLPQYLSGTVTSNDPTTFAFDDPAIFTITNEDHDPVINPIIGTICENSVYTLNDIDYTEPGIYTQTFQSTSGTECDSILELTLNVLPNVSHNIVADICNGSSYQINNVDYYTPGIHTETVTGGAENGCDSIIILDLSFSDTLFYSVSVDLCPGEFYTQNGQNFDQTGNYEIFYPNGAAGGCDSLIYLDLDVEESLDYNLETTPIYCVGDTDGSISLNISNTGLAPYQYALNDGPFQDENTFENLAPGVYTIAVQTASNCETIIEDIAVIDESSPLVLLSNQTEFDISLGTEIQLDFVANFDIDSIIWLPEGNWDCPDCLSQRFVPLENGAYQVITYDQYGCMATISYRLNVTKEPEIYVPNVFSPNGDGINDMITIYAGRSVREIEAFAIFDRWGEAVFLAENFQPNIEELGWDGKLRGKPMNPAVFAYTLKARCIDGGIALQKGDITLIK